MRVCRTSPILLLLLKQPTDMNNLRKRIHCFLASEEGPTAVEYAVMLAFIVTVCLAECVNGFETVCIGI